MRKRKPAKNTHNNHKSSINSPIAIQTINLQILDVIDLLQPLHIVLDQRECGTMYRPVLLVNIAQLNERVLWNFHQFIFDITVIFMSCNFRHVAQLNLKNFLLLDRFRALAIDYLITSVDWYHDALLVYSFFYWRMWTESIWKSWTNKSSLLLLFLLILFGWRDSTIRLIWIAANLLCQRVRDERKTRKKYILINKKLQEFFFLNAWN